MDPQRTTPATNTSLLSNLPASDKIPPDTHLNSNKDPTWHTSDTHAASSPNSPNERANTWRAGSLDSLHRCNWRPRSQTRNRIVDCFGRDMLCLERDCKSSRSPWLLQGGGEV